MPNLWGGGGETKVSRKWNGNNKGWVEDISPSTASSAARLCHLQSWRTDDAVYSKSSSTQPLLFLLSCKSCGLHYVHFFLLLDAASIRVQQICEGLKLQNSKSRNVRCTTCAAKNTKMEILKKKEELQSPIWTCDSGKKAEFLWTPYTQL